MPLLGEKGKLKVVLETASRIADEEVWVEIQKIVLAEDVDNLDLGTASTEERTQHTYQFLAKSILDWNLFLKEGEKAPITVENLRKLPIDDLTDLQNKFEYEQQLSRVKKNNLSSTSITKENPESMPPSNTSS